MKSLNYNKAITLFFTFPLIVLLCLGLYIKHLEIAPLPSVTINSDIQVTTNSEEKPCATSTDPTIVQDGAYVKGYGLFLQSEYEKPGCEVGYPSGEDTYPDIAVVEQGKVESGVYAGYNRFTITRTSEGIGGAAPAPYFFITKDYKTFIFVYHPLAPYLPKDYDMLYQTIDKRKVTAVVDNTVDKINFPDAPTLVFGSLEYVLREVNVEIPKDSHKIGATASGFDVYDDPVLEGEIFGSFGYNLWNASTTEAERNIKMEEQKKLFIALGNYYTSSTRIFVKNSYGSIAAYSLGVQRGEKPKQTITGYDDYFTNVLYKSDIVASEPVYATYNQVTPEPCGISTDSYVTKNILDSEVRKIGKTKSGLDIFTLIDKNHPILKAQFIEKISQYNNRDFFEINRDLKLSKKPTYAEYVAKNPVLLFRDTWGRLIAVGEYDFKLEGGCGKPVIYLYPEKTTEVHIDFKNDMQLTTVIPSYSKGWDVIAKPSGALSSVSKDSCVQYIDAKHGGEYAYEACLKNEYPYIYWAGNAFATYPKQTEGFVVGKDALKVELESKLNMLGLSEKEIKDMVEYWYPEMMKRNSPYYRISFVQTAEMNSFIPMNVIPKPDSVIRVFLDWEPLNELKTIVSQKLVKGMRNGFTYVEWGGLKR
ncbi:MAG: hypothetical protein V4576_01575 [Patescibacteria group bacterium]